MKNFFEFLLKSQLVELWILMFLDWERAIRLRSLK